MAIFTDSIQIQMPFVVVAAKSEKDYLLRL
jgi:hypothetical protein